MTIPKYPCIGLNVNKSLITLSTSDYSEFPKILHIIFQDHGGYSSTSSSPYFWTWHFPRNVGRWTGCTWTVTVWPFKFTFTILMFTVNVKELIDHLSDCAVSARERICIHFALIVKLNTASLKKLVWCVLRKLIVYIEVNRLTSQSENNHYQRIRISDLKFAFILTRVWRQDGPICRLGDGFRNRFLNWTCSYVIECR